MFPILLIFNTKKFSQEEIKDKYNDLNKILLNTNIRNEVNNLYKTNKIPRPIRYDI